MVRASLHLVVLILAFSTLILSSSAVPSTRSAQLLQETRVLPVPSNDTSLQVVGGEITMEEGINGKMDIEINDYPGSGPNNRHSPKPPGRRLLGLVVTLI